EAFQLSAFADDSDGSVTLRLDSAVEEGDIVPAAYDSMIAKAIAHAPTRDEAMDALAEALRNADIWPVTTNAAMLANLLDVPEMRDGVATTNLVEANIDDLATPDDAERADALIIAAIGLQAMHGVGADPWDHPDGFRINGVSQSTFVFGMDGEPHVVRLTRDEDGVERARIGAETFETDMATAILR